MAKRKREVEEVDAEELEREHGKKKKPKKKRKCLRCCLAFLITVIVILAAGVGVGCYFGDKILKDKFDVSLGSTFKILSNFKNYKKVEKGALKNYKLTDADADNFVDSLTTAILLDPEMVDSGEVKDLFSELIADLLDKDEAPATENTQTQTQILSSEGETDAEESITDKFLALFTADNINVDRIKQYPNEKSLEDFYLKINGKELAAFINNVVFPVIIEKLDLEKTIKEAFEDSLDAEVNVDVKKLISLSQIRFYKDGNTPRMSVIVKVAPRELTDQAIKGVANPDVIFGKDQGNGFMRWCVKAGGTMGKGIVNLFFVPKTLYITADLELSIGAGQETLNPKFSINSTTQDDIKTLDKITDGAITKPLNETFAVSGGVGDIIKKLNEAVPLDQGEVVADNTISVNAVQLAFDMLINGDKEVSKRAQSSDFFFVIAKVLGLDTESAMTGKPDYTKVQFARDNITQELLLNPDGTPQLTDLTVRPEPTAIDGIKEDYKEAIVAAFTKYFGFSVDNGTPLDTSDDKTFDDLMNVLLDSNTDALLEMLDGEAIKELTKQNGSMIITDKMMAAIVACTKDKLLEDVGDDLLQAEFFEPRYVALEVIEGNDQKNHNILEVGIEIKLNELLGKFLTGSDEFVSGLLDALLGDSMLIIARIDITLDSTITPLEDTLTVGGWGEETDSVFETINRLLGAFGSEAFSIDDIVGDLSSAVKNVIDTMNSVLPIKIGESKIIMPDVFEAIAYVLNADLEPDKKLLASDIKTSLGLLVDGYDAANGENASFNTDSEAFLAKLNNTTNPYNPMSAFSSGYAINDSMKFDDFMDAMISGFEGEDGFLSMIDTVKLAQYSAPTYNLGAVEIDGYMLYSMLKYMFNKGDISLSSDFDFNINDVVYIEMSTFTGADLIKHDYAEITVLIDPTMLMGTGDSPEMKLIKEILNEKIYVTLKIDITLAGSGFVRKSDIYFNGNIAKTETALKLIEQFEANVADNLDNVKEELENAFANVLRDINNSNVIEAEFKTDRFELTKLFDAIAKAIDDDGVINTDEPNGADMRVVMDCMLNDSKNKVPSTLDFDGYYYNAGSTTEYSYIANEDDRAGKTKVVFGDILFNNFADAYPIDKTEAGNLKTLTDILAGTSVGIDLAKIIDSAKFEEAVFDDTPDKVKIDNLQLAGMIQSRWDTIETTYELKYVDIKIIGGKSYVAMAISIPLSALGLPEDVRDILTSTDLLVALVVDIDGESDGNLTVYNDLFDINLSGTDKSGRVMEVVEKFNKGGIKFTEIADSVRKVFVDLSGSGMTFENDTNKDVMIMPDIFGLIHNMNYKNDFNSGTEIQTALRGIHDVDDSIITNEIAPEGTMSLGSWITAKVAQLQITSISQPVNMGMSDSELGRIIANEAGTNLGFGKILSFTILAGTDTDEDANDVRTWVNGFDESDADNLNSSQDYAVAIFEMSLTAITGGGMQPIASSILPEKFFATAVLKWDYSSATPFELEQFRINDMSKANQDNLYKMLGFGSASGSTLDDTIEAHFTACSGSISNVMTMIEGAIQNVEVDVFTQTVKFNVTDRRFAEYAAGVGETAVGQYEMVLTPYLKQA